MSIRSEISPLEAIEILLDEARVEEEVQLAVLEALGEFDDPRQDEFLWDDLLLDEIWSGDGRWDGLALDGFARRPE